MLKRTLLTTILLFICLEGMQGQTLDLNRVVQVALQANPNIAVAEDQVLIREGAWQAEAGQFDAQVFMSFAGSREHTPVAQGGTNQFLNITTNANTYTIGIEKEFASGLTLTPQVRMTRQDDFTTGGTLNNASASLALNIPLLQGRGTHVNTAGVLAAAHNYEAGLLSLQHTRAQMVMQAGLAYWNYLAAWQNLEAFQESEARARTLFEETQQLIAADERPAADLKQLEANLAAKTAQRISAEQQAFASAQQLGLAMGLSPEKMQTLGAPGSSFPEVDEGILEQGVREVAFTDLALRRRADLAATQTEAQAARVRFNQARNILKPQLNVALNLGYAGVTSGTELEAYFTPFGNNVAGLNMGATLTYAFPFKNRSAHGLSIQREAVYRQQVTTGQDLNRTIRANVRVALKGLERSIYELRSSEAALELYQTAVENEKKKFQMGLSTLIDVMTVEDRLTDVRLNHIAGQQRYANALIQLRFETGTLLQTDGNKVAVNAADFFTLPAATAQ